MLGFLIPELLVWLCHTGSVQCQTGINVGLQDLNDLAAWLKKLGCQHGLLQQCWPQHVNICPGPQAPTFQHPQPPQLPSSSTPAALENGSDGPTAAISVSTLPGTEAEWLHAWGSPDASLCPAWRCQRLGQQDAPANWRQYYALRGITPESPAGVGMVLAVVSSVLLTAASTLRLLLPQYLQHICSQQCLDSGLSKCSRHLDCVVLWSTTAPCCLSLHSVLSHDPFVWHT